MVGVPTMEPSIISELSHPAIFRQTSQIITFTHYSLNLLHCLLKDLDINIDADA